MHQSQFYHKPSKVQTFSPDKNAGVAKSLWCNFWPVLYYSLLLCQIYKMRLTLEIRNPAEAQLLIHYIRQFASVQVVQAKDTVQQPAVNRPTFWAKHYGSIDKA